MGSAKSSWDPTTIPPKIYLSPSFLAEPGETCPPLAYFTRKRALGADKYSEFSPLSSQPEVNVCALGGYLFGFLWQFRSTRFRSNCLIVFRPGQNTSRVLVRRRMLFRSNQLLVSRPGKNTSLVVFGASVQYRSLSSNYSLQIKESWQFSKIFNNYLDSCGSWLLICMVLNNKIGCVLTNNFGSWGRGLGVITT